MEERNWKPLKYFLHLHMYLFTCIVSTILKHITETNTLRNVLLVARQLSYDRLTVLDDLDWILPLANPLRGGNRRGACFPACQRVRNLDWLMTLPLAGWDRPSHQSVGRIRNHTTG